MPAISKWMMSFGLLLLASSIGAWYVEDYTIRTGLANGLAMIAAGAASAQGRRSLRRTGLFVGIVIPVLIALVFAWRAVEQWKRYGAGGLTMRTPLFTTAIALAAGVVVIAMIRLRTSRQSEIAERGYSLTTPAHLRSNRS